MVLTKTLTENMLEVYLMPPVFLQVTHNGNATFHLVKLASLNTIRAVIKHRGNR